MSRTDYAKLREKARDLVRGNSVTARLLGEVRVLWFTRVSRQAELRMCMEHVREGTMFIDVGAMLGDFSLASCHRLGRTGVALALEPNPVAYQELLTATAGARVAALNLAASDSSYWATLEVPLDDSGRSHGALGSLESRSGYDDLTKYQVRAVPLDDIVSAVLPVSVIKIDVEGHELAVIRGAAEILRRDRPVLVVEIEERHLHGHEMHDVVECVTDQGYAAYAIGSAGLIPWAEFDIYESQTRWLQSNCGVAQVVAQALYVNNFVFLPV